jgi:hypothetical protein
MASLQQPVDKCTSNESGRAGYECSQVSPEECGNLPLAEGCAFTV